MSNPARRCSRLLCLVTACGVVLTAAHAQQVIRIDGSTGTAPLVRALGKAFEAGGGARVDIGGGLGTKARFEALAGGKIDIAMASHGLKVGEIEKRGMRVHRIAATPVVFAVHKSVSVSSLTDAQICDIYRGAIRNWKDIGGGDQPIVAMARPDSEVDAEVARAGVGCLKALKFSDTVQVQNKSGDMAKALARTAGAIGMTTTTVVEQSGGALRSVALNGITPTGPNVLSNQYKLVRDAFLVTQSAPSPAVQALLAFVRSEGGAKVIGSNGAIAVSPR